MVLSQQQRAPLPAGLNGGDSGCFLDAAFRVVVEVCEAFYDTLNYTELESPPSDTHT